MAASPQPQSLPPSLFSAWADFLPCWRFVALVIRHDRICEICGKFSTDLLSKISNPNPAKFNIQMKTTFQTQALLLGATILATLLFAGATGSAAIVQTVNQTGAVANGWSAA